MSSFVKYGFGVLVVLGLACGTPEGEYQESQYREDVIACSEAVARAKECCSISAPNDACEFHHLVPRTCGGCSSNHGTSDFDDEKPVLSVDVSRRVVTQSCDDMRANGGCESLHDQIHAVHLQHQSGSYDCY